MSFAILTSLSGAAALAAPPEPLDADFLDYLANCEGKDDNWTVVASVKERKKKVATTPTKPTAPNSEEPNKEAKP